MARTHHPDIIILDLHLPDLDGDQVLVKLKGDPETRDIPVCMLSADAQKNQIRRLRGFGAAEYLTKPFHVDELIRVVANLAGKGRSEDSRPAPADPPSSPDP
jgi:CheY-like chemotaxis protein